MGKIEITLKQLGLSDNEVKVYLEALKHDEISPNQLSKLTKIPRTTVYDVVTDLSLKGLVKLFHSTGLEKQQTTLKALNPSKLRENIWQKRDELTSLEVDLVKILPDLKNTFFSQPTDSNVKYYPGIEGAKHVLDDHVKNDVDAQGYMFSQMTAMDFFGMDLINQNADEEIAVIKKKKHKLKELITLNEWTKHVLSYQVQRNPDYLKVREMRFIDNPLFEIQQDIYIKGDYVNMIASKDNEIWGLLSYSKVMARTLLSIFNIIWQSATPITKELVDSWGENDFLRHQKIKERKEN